MTQMKGEPLEGEVVEERESLELARLPDQALRPIDMELFQAWADSRAKALQILMAMGIAQTRAEDWSDQGGKPYPEQGACSSMINMVGIVISSPAVRKELFEDEAGRYYVYFLDAEVTVPRFGIGPLPIVGRASSRDQSFAYRTEETEEGGRQKVLRPDSEIDPGDIRAKAYTNLRYRAVKAVVPQVANLSWEELRSLTGGRVQQGAVKQVAYGQGEAPKCPVHNAPMRPGRKGGWYCPRKVGDGYCQQRVAPGAVPEPDTAEAEVLAEIDALLVGSGATNAAQKSLRIMPWLRENSVVLARGYVDIATLPRARLEQLREYLADGGESVGG